MSSPVAGINKGLRGDDSSDCIPDYFVFLLTALHVLPRLYTVHPSNICLLQHATDNRLRLDSYGKLRKGSEVSMMTFIPGASTRILDTFGRGPPHPAVPSQGGLQRVRLDRQVQPPGYKSAPESG